MTRKPSHPLVKKLLCFTALSDKDQSILRNLGGQPRSIEARQPLSEEGTAPSSVILLLDGIAARLKRLPDGRRQIVSFMLPGDLSDLHSFVPRLLDHSAETISACKILDIARTDLDTLQRRPAIATGLHVSATIEEAIIKEWLVNVGRRNSVERAAHLLCEFLFRLRAIGLAENNRFHFPVTQGDLADSTCLSVVHINRILQDFRDAGMLSSRGDTLEIHDAAALQNAGGFSEAYLELSRHTAQPHRNLPRGSGIGPPSPGS